MSWRLGVIGSPVAHSLTPAIHAAALEALGLTGTSEAIEVERDDAASLSAALAGHDALSVTMPLKEVVIERCDELDDVAQRVGGVNSVLRRHGRLMGRAFDGAGFLDALAADLAVDVAGRRVVVRGSGGAAKSIVDALVEAGAVVFVLARNNDALATLASRYPSIEVNARPIDDVDVFVNTIPVGSGVDGAMDAAVRSYAAGAAALDIVYAPAETPWLAARRDEGLRVANGLSMLVHQARHQLRWWFEREVPLEPLMRAVGR